MKKINGKLAVAVPTTEGIGWAVAGERGYYPSELKCERWDKAQELADRLNKDIDPALVEAIHVGSMFGFHVPGAKYKGMILA